MSEILKRLARERGRASEQGSEPQAVEARQPQEEEKEERKQQESPIRNPYLEYVQNDDNSDDFDVIN